MLLTALGVYAARTLNGLSNAEAVEIRKYLTRSERLLSAHRLLTSAAGAVHDYLLDRDPSALPAHCEGARRSWVQAMQAFDAYKEVAAQDALGLTDALDSQLSRYWTIADAALELEGEQRRDAQIHPLHHELIPMRDGLFLTVNEIGSRDRGELESEIARTARVVRGSEHRLWVVVAVASLLALLIAAATFRHLIGLERTTVPSDPIATVS